MMTVFFLFRDVVFMVSVLFTTGNSYLLGSSRYYSGHTNHCLSSPCLNAGKCQETNTGRRYECECFNGYFGDNCQKSHCTSAPCQNGGTCTHLTFGYRCDCADDYFGHSCETLKSTVTSSTTRSTTTSSRTKSTTSATTRVSTTRRPVNFSNSCSKYTAIFNIAERVMEINKNSTKCSSGSTASPEAFVMNLCDVTSSSTWRQGVKVMDNCGVIPAYTPVASFYGGTYNRTSGVSGIFIKCLQDEDGFQMVVQRCDSFPLIEHIVTRQDSPSIDPRTFYTIELSS